MQAVDVVILGAGQAGLAMSHYLTAAGVDHVLLERGRVAERWRSERWDSLRLLTPNWLSRLPGHQYEGDDPHGYMRAREVAQYLQSYADRSRAPVQEHTTVNAVRRGGRGFVVNTDRGSWDARSVVVATGEAGVANVPSVARCLPNTIFQMTPTHYRNPAQLPDGGVLVVGASSTGTQLADEIRAAGRRVVLAVGSHARMPRRYRDRDIMEWLECSGLWSRSIETADDPEALRRQPSFQLVGRSAGHQVDLPALQRRGVELRGRLRAIDGDRVDFADDLAETTALADARLDRVLDRVDRFAASCGISGTCPRPAPFARVPVAPPRLDLRREGIGSVLWATGYRPHMPWLRVPVFGIDGRIMHRLGVTPAAGLYAMGLRGMRTPKSTSIDGVGADARALLPHLLNFLAEGSRAAPRPARKRPDRSSVTAIDRMPGPTGDLFA